MRAVYLDSRLVGADTRGSHTAPCSQGIREAIQVVLPIDDALPIDADHPRGGDSIQTVDRNVGRAVDVDNLLLAVGGRDTRRAVVILRQESKHQQTALKTEGRLTEKKL